jgi:peptidyl-prolyl cis-trans isomerase SurA
MIGPRVGLLVASLLLSGGGAATRYVAAQRPIAAVDSVVDRIVAVVGSKAILASNIEERILQEFPQNKGLPTAPEELRALRQDILSMLVNEELLVQEAARDTTIKVLDDDVTKSVDALVKTTRARYASEDEYRKDLRVSGFETPDEYRSWLTEQQRRSLTIRDLLSKQRSGGKLKPVAPTEKEIREYFDKNKAGFPKRSETISFRQIVVAPPSSVAAKTRAYALADSILAELRKGADFAAAAKRFSMDPSTKDQGGGLGWVRRGTGLDQRFEEVAFALRPGTISEPVETSFGFHLIQVERAQPAEVQVRHILIMAAVDTANADSALRTAQSLRAALVKGESFDSLQRVWHDKPEERELVNFAMANLPPTYAEPLANLRIGQLSDVFRLESPVDLLRSKFVIVLVTGRLPAGDVRLEDVKEQIRGALADQLTQQRYIDRLRRATLVEVRTG